MSGKLLYEPIKDTYLFHNISSVLLHSKHKFDLLRFFFCVCYESMRKRKRPTAGPQNKLLKGNLLCKNMLIDTLISNKEYEVTLTEHFIRNNIPLILGRSSLCFQNSLSSSWNGFHMMMVLVQVDMIFQALQISCFYSTTSQRCSTGFRSGDFKGH